jgi:hypothetical protein
MPPHAIGRTATRICCLVLAAIVVSGCATVKRQPTGIPPLTYLALDPLFDDIEERAFRFFWEIGDPVNGMMPDRHPSPSPASIAAIGFALNAYPIGVERGYIPRDQARDRTLVTLRFLRDAPQGPEPSGKSGYHGFFYHFLDMKTGTRFGANELSTVDTALLMAGVLFAGGYFDADTPEEREIRAMADELYRRVEWTWAMPRPPSITLAWSPEQGFFKYDWRGYNESMMVYILALGSPTYAPSADAWQAWLSRYEGSWGKLGGTEFLTFAPMFGHQYAAIWIDYRDIQDGYMKERGFDYFENSRRAVYTQRAYAIANPLGWRGYGKDAWGITASDGPADIYLPYQNEIRIFRTYAARGVGLNAANNYDDGTLAPTAVIGSLPFAPELVIPTTVEMHRAYGEHIYGRYGFFDAFNMSFRFDVKLFHGRRVPGFGWVDTDYLGIDQGPILAMIENYRSELIWSVMRSNSYLRRGLERAGFTGGWLE